MPCSSLDVLYLLGVEDLPGGNLVALFHRESRDNGYFRGAREPVHAMMRFDTAQAGYCSLTRRQRGAGADDAYEQRPLCQAKIH